MLGYGEVLDTGERPDEAGLDAGARPLSREDLSILALENETVAGHTCKVILLDGAVDPGSLRTSISGRLPRAPMLSMRLGEIDGAPWWVPAHHVDMGAHVVTAATSGAGDEAGFRATVAGIFARHLDRSRPLWRIDVIPRRPGGGSALIWRIHHALADGMTAMRMASAVLWDEAPAPGARAPATGPRVTRTRSRAPPGRPGQRRITGWPRCWPPRGRCRSPGCGRRLTGTSMRGGRSLSPRPGSRICTAPRRPRTARPSTTRC